MEQHRVKILLGHCRAQAGSRLLFVSCRGAGRTMSTTVGNLPSDQSSGRGEGGTGYTVGRTPAILAMTAVVAVSLGLFSPTLLSGETFFFRDVLHYYWPTRFVAAQAWGAFELPQWNPFQQAGLPLLGDIHAGVFYPMNVLYQWLAFPSAYLAFILVHHLILGAGVLFLLRRLGCPWHSAVAGAAVFMLSGYVVGLVNAGPLMAGVSLVPWVMWAISSPAPSERVVIAVGFLLALQGCSGDPQSVVYSGIAGGVVVVGLPGRVRRGIALALAFALAGLLAGVQLLPAWQLWEMSNRSVSAVDAPVYWSLHPMRLLEVFAPYPWGKFLDEPKFWAARLFAGPVALPFSLSVYMGGSTLALVLAGCRRGRLLWLGCALALIGLVLAAAPHLCLQWVIEKGPLGFFRYSEKYFVLVALGVAFCAAHAAGSVQDSLPSWRLLVIVVVALAIPMVALSAGVVDIAALMSASFPQRFDDSVVVGETVQAALAIGAACGGALLGLLVLARVRRSTEFLKAAIPMVLSVDLLAASIPVVWSASPGLYQLRSPVAEWLVDNGGLETRVFRDDYALRSVAPPSRNMEELRERRAWELLTLKSNLSAIFGIREMGGYGAVDLRRTIAVVGTLRRQPTRLMQVFGARHVISADGAPIGKDPALVLAARVAGLGVSLYENENWIPPLRGVEQVVGATSEEEAFRLLADTRIDLKTAAVVEGADSSQLSHADLTEVRFTDRSARATVSAAERGGFVVYSGAYYPGWRVFVDGEEATLRVVNGAVMGVSVPEGRHDVEFVFSERALPLGLVLTLVGLGVSLGLLALGAFRRATLLRGG